MGWDLIGYFIFLPDKFTEEEKQILRDHQTKFKNIMSDFEGLERDENLLVSDEVLDKFLEDIEDRLDWHFDENDYMQKDDIFTDIEETISHIEGLLKTTDYISYDSLTVMTSIKLFDRIIRIVFTGDMNDPGHQNYYTIENLQRTGVADFIERMLFPTGSKALHFIKND